MQDGRGFADQRDTYKVLSHFGDVFANASRSRVEKIHVLLVLFQLHCEGLGGIANHELDASGREVILILIWHTETQTLISVNESQEEAGRRRRERPKVPGACLGY